MYTRNCFKTLAVGTLIILWGGSGLALAQTAEDALRLSQRAPATGARMIGIGTAGYGGFGDYGAFFGNPAGLGLIERSSLTGTIHSLRTSDKAFSQTQGFASSGRTNATGATNLGNLAWTYKVPTRQGALVLGLAFNQAATYERELRFSGTNSASTITTSFLPFAEEYSLDQGGALTDLADLVFSAFNGGFVEFYGEFLADDSTAYPFLEAVVPGSSIEQRGRITETGRMNEASFGGSVEVAEGMLVGASLNVAFGRYQFRSRFEEDDVNDENTPADYSVLQDDGSLLEGFSFLRYAQRLKSDLVGVNLRVGISAEISPALRIGATIETPTRHSIDESYGTSYETHFDFGGILAYGHHADDVGSGVFSYHLRTPWRLGTGISFAMQNITLLADAEIVDWSSMRFSGSGGAYFDALNDQIKDEYGMVLNVGAGAEIAFGQLFLRGGAALRSDPLTLDLTKSNGEALNRDQMHVSAGIGYRASERMRLDVGWTLASYEGAYLPYPVDEYGPRQKASLHIDESVARHQLVVGITYSF